MTPRRATRLVGMMVRPPVAVVLALFAALGMAEAGRPEDLGLLIGVIAVVSAWFVHVTAVNDLSDEAIDRVNLARARGRPLVSGHASRGELRVLAAVAGVLAVGGGALVDRRVAVVVLLGIALSTAYSTRPVRLSERGVIAPLVLPLGFVAVPFLAGAYAAGGHLPPHAWVLLAGLWIGFTGRIVLKDYRDTVGDAMFGKRTFLLRHGPSATLRFSATCWVAGSAPLVVVVSWHSLLGVLLVVYVAGALHGLRVLATETDRIRQQVVIGSIATIGRGMVIGLLAQVTLLHEHWSQPARAAVTISLGVVFLGMYVAMLGERDRVLEIHPY